MLKIKRRYEELAKSTVISTVTINDKTVAIQPVPVHIRARELKAVVHYTLAKAGRLGLYEDLKPFIKDKASSGGSEYSDAVLRWKYGLTSVRALDEALSVLKA